MDISIRNKEINQVIGELPSGKDPAKHGWAPEKHLIFVAINKRLD